MSFYKVKKKELAFCLCNAFVDFYTAFDKVINANVYFEFIRKPRLPITNGCPWSCSSKLSSSSSRTYCGKCWMEAPVLTSTKFANLPMKHSGDRQMTEKGPLKTWASFWTVGYWPTGSINTTLLQGLRQKLQGFSAFFATREKGLS